MENICLEKTTFKKIVDVFDLSVENSLEQTKNFASVKHILYAIANLSNDNKYELELLSKSALSILKNAERKSDLFYHEINKKRQEMNEEFVEKKDILSDERKNNASND